MTTKNAESSKVINYHNLIILDRSGSMESIRQQAIVGVQETISTIRKFQARNPDTCQYVSLVAFCGCGVDTLIDNVPVDRLPALDPNLYRPCCMTPLYDAIGTSCSKLLVSTVAETDARYSATVITDGYENASKEWNAASVSRLITDLKSRGWLFSYIGADHDVHKVAVTISIDNAMQFDKTPEGTRQMFNRENVSRTRWMADVKCMAEEEMCARNKTYFKD